MEKEKKGRKRERRKGVEEQRREEKRQVNVEIKEMLKTEGNKGNGQKQYTTIHIVTSVCAGLSRSRSF